MIKVLICEDMELIRKCFVALLGFEPEITVVGEAVNGWEALEQVDALQPDVVLMDLCMPVMDGLEATRAIKENHPRTQVVMLSSYSDHEDVLKCIEAGASAYVLKVASPSELVPLIERVCQGERFAEIVGTLRPYPELPYAHAAP